MGSVVTLMGSGELSPTMVKTHRAVFEGIGSKNVTTSFLDTPYEFQENREELSKKIIDYFSVSLNISMSKLPSSDDIETDSLSRARFVDLFNSSDLIFSGPGSPTYALRKWRNKLTHSLMRKKVIDGGAVTFASAAALTLGKLTVPVYEIYKVGEEVVWKEGLDILGIFGINVAVIPHYNNAEGGTHDTRFCYLGENRLARLEQQISSDIFLLGIDEHTAAVFDVEREEISVTGLGKMTVRVEGRSSEIPSGEILTFKDLSHLAIDLTSKSGSVPHQNENLNRTTTGNDPDLELKDLDANPYSLIWIRNAAEDFRKNLDSKDVDDALRVAFQTIEKIILISKTCNEETVLAWSNEFKSMILALGELAKIGTIDPETQIKDFVDLLLNLREEARIENNWKLADKIRDALGELKIEIQDNSSTSTWKYRSI